jgi:hypothetical protein
MEVARLLLALVLGVAGGLVIIGNWRTFFLGIRGEHAPSWVPLVGGALVSFCCWLAPSPWLNANWPIPFFLDWGTIPGLTHTLAYWLLFRSGGADTEQTIRRSRIAACVIVFCSFTLVAVRVVVSVPQPSVGVPTGH